MVLFLSFLERGDKLTEAIYQSKLKKKLEKRLPDAFVLKIDPTATGIQGFPDLLILRNDKWAALEVKKDEYATHRPNQDHYVNQIKHMGNYSAFIFPENEKEVLNELERALSS